MPNGGRGRSVDRVQTWLAYAAATTTNVKLGCQDGASAFVPRTRREPSIRRGYGSEVHADPESVVACAIEAVRTGEVASDLRAVGAAECRPIALQRVASNAVVIVLTQAADGKSIVGLRTVGVFLRQSSEGSWVGPSLMSGVRLPDAAVIRQRSSWHGWGAVIAPSAGGFAPGPTEEHAHLVTPTAISRPDASWKWVTGVAAETVQEVRAWSTMDSRSALPQPTTGAFVVLVRARWDEEIQAAGTTADGYEFDVFNQLPSEWPS
jgi:hypothetical protein